MRDGTGRLFPTAADIWRGRVGLRRTVWLYGFVGAVGLAIPMNFARGFGVNPQNALWFGYALALVAYSCFICVGIWRSAGRYQGGRLLPVMARVTVVLVWLIMGVSFAYGVNRGQVPRPGAFLHDGPEQVLPINPDQHGG